MNNTANTTAQHSLPQHELLTHKSVLRSLKPFGWLFAVVILAIAVFVQMRKYL